jgi:hypothetical protein
MEGPFISCSELVTKWDIYLTFNHAIKGSSLQILHYNKQQSAVLTVVQHLNNVRMTQFTDRPSESAGEFSW